MTADVNVTEKVVRALYDRAWGRGWEFAEDVRDAMHAALRRPEVLAGIAGVLREHGAPTEAFPDDEFDCCAAAVVEWLTGGAR